MLRKLKEYWTKEKVIECHFGGYYPALQEVEEIIDKEIRETQIKESAYKKWEQSGKPQGKDLEFWLQAEQEQIMHEMKCKFSY